MTDQPTQPAPVVAAGRGAPHLAVASRDPAAAARWWCATLGFVLVERGPQGAVRRHAVVPGQVTIRHPDSGLVIAIRPRQPEMDLLGKASFLSLRVASREALDGWSARLSELGVPHSPVQDLGDERCLSLVGPEGIGLELWWSRNGRG